jgi:hypothetical protein
MQRHLAPLDVAFQGSSKPDLGKLVAGLFQPVGLDDLFGAHSLGILPSLQQCS